MGYKLENLIINRSDRDTKYIQKAWAHKIAEYANFTIREELFSNGYWCSFNDNEFTIYNSAFGTAAKGTTSYRQTGFTMTIGNVSNFSGTKSRSKIIIDTDTNNVIYGSSPEPQSIYMQGASCVAAFLLTNGGVMNPINPIIYSIGASPAQMMDCKFGMSQYLFQSGAAGQGNIDELSVYTSDMMAVDNDNIIHLRDHVKFLYSHQKQLYKYIQSEQNSINQFEHITVDGDKYLALGGAAWIKIDEEEDVEIDADSYT